MTFTTPDAAQPSTEAIIKKALQYHQQGQLEHAARLYQQVLAHNSNHANALQLMGIILGAQNNLAESARLMERSLEIEPNQPHVNLNLGRTYLRDGQTDKAIQQFRRVLEDAPDSAPAWFELGLAMEAANNMPEAMEAYRNALIHKPDYINATINLAILYFNSGKFDLAEPLFITSLEAYPTHITALNGYGCLLHQQGKVEEAVSHYRRALDVDPYSAEAHMNLGYAYHDLKRNEEALTHCERAVELSPSIAVAHNNLAICLQAIGRVADAETAAREATRLNPQYSNAYNNLGNALQAQGKKSEAAAMYREAIRLNPSYAMAYRNLGLVSKLTDKDQPLIDAMEKIAQAPDISSNTHMHIRYALGKAYSDLKDPDTAFPHYAEANRLRRLEVKYDTPAVKAYFEQIKQVYTEDFVKQAPTSGLEDNTPIFILGQPRSGTTLTEQILASHPDVFGAEELAYMGQIANTFCHREFGKVYPECMSDANPEKLARIGENYLKQLRTHDATVKHITDKMPANFQYIGMILQTLPNAKIVHCTRNPMDNCFSIFKYYFVGSINYAYDLQELGEYYLLYRDLMEHWHRLYPGRIYDLNYEAMIQSPDTVIPQLVEYCGLPWDDACLDFHSTKRDVRTASAMQVRQPIYTTSVEAWRPYEKHLKPLYDVLRSGGAI